MKKFYFLLLMWSIFNFTNYLLTASFENKKEEMESARFKIGPFRFLPLIFIRNAGYDSNVYGTPWDPVADYTFTAGPGLNMYLPVKKKVIFSLFYSPQYTYFYKEEKERTWNHYLEEDLFLVLRRYVINIGKNYSNARERWNTEIDIRPRRKVETTRVSISLHTKRRLNYELGWKRGIYDHENLYYERFNFRDILNRREDRFTGILRYQVLPKTGVFLEYEKAFINFQNPLSKRDSRSDAISFGFDFHPSSIINGKTKIGFMSFRSIEREGQDYRGLIGDTDINIRIFRFLRLRGFYIRDVQFSIFYNNTYFIESRYGAGGSLYGLKRFRLDYTYSMGTNRYPAMSEEIKEKRFDKYRVHNLAIYFRLKGRTGIGITGSRWFRDSNLEWEKDRRYIIGAQLINNF